MDTVRITIDTKEYQVPKNMTILQAAKSQNVYIPTLCNLKYLKPRANCRMCVVEVEGMRTLQPACATGVREGMVIHTMSERVVTSRKMTLELILADHAVDCHHCMRIGSSRCDSLDPEFCEMCFFCDCVRDGFCELQKLAREYKVDRLPYEIEAVRHTIDDSLGSVIRNPNKCVKCRRCLDICDQIQCIHNLAVIGRGNGVKIGPAMGRTMADSECIRCGKCVENCPTGALFLQEHKDEFIYYAHDYKTCTVMQISSEALGKLRNNLARCAHQHYAEVTMEMLAGSLKKIGIDAVYDEKEAQEEAKQEAIALLEEADFTKPVILTNSFAAKNFLRKHYESLSESFAFYSSCQEIFGRLAGRKVRAAMPLEQTELKVFQFASNNEDAAESLEDGTADLTVNANELLRIFQRTGAEPNENRTAELDSFGIRQTQTPYDEFLRPAAWSMETEPEKIAVPVKGKTRTAYLCTNLSQADRILQTMQNGIHASTEDNREPIDIVRIIG